MVNCAINEFVSRTVDLNLAQLIKETYIRNPICNCTISSSNQTCKVQTAQVLVSPIAKDEFETSAKFVGLIATF